jgi:hypothetical protein
VELKQLAKVMLVVHQQLAQEVVEAVVPELPVR